MTTNHNIKILYIFKYKTVYDTCMQLRICFYGCKHVYCLWFYKNVNRVVDAKFSARTKTTYLLLWSDITWRMTSSCNDGVITITTCLHCTTMAIFILNLQHKMFMLFSYRRWNNISSFFGLHCFKEISYWYLYLSFTPP